MTGLVRLLDTLLTAKVSPPLDAGAVDAQSAVKAPGAASGVQKLSNDVRLPSNAALERELGGVDSALTRGLAGSAPAAGAALPASALARLSFAARIISAVLADLEVDVGPVRGQGPILASRAEPAGPALAGSLAQTVSNSGLFYESHLAQFAQGQRSLAQLAQEPQARWSTAPAPVGLRAGTPAAPAASAAVGAPAVPTGGSATPVIAAAGDAVPSAAIGPAADVGAPGQTTAAPSSLLATSTDGASLRSASGPAVAAGAPAASLVTDSNAAAETAIDTRKLQAAYGWGQAAPAPASAAADIAESAQSHRLAQAQADRPPSSGEASGAPASAEVVHPQLVTLVHQQLDLLATAAFRWSGDAWPGVPMDWSIQEEEARRQPEGDAEPQVARRWSTRLSLHLPVLGPVEVRLSVAGADVRASVVAPSEASRARLAGDGAKLAARFDAAQLRLDQFQVAQGEVA